MLKVKALTIAALCTLASCGGNDTSVKESNNNQPGQNEPNQNQTTPTPSALEKSSSSALETHIKNGLYQSNIATTYTTEETATPDVVDAQSAVQSDSFSSTTVQEQGVDEGDRIKYNGELIFIANNNRRYYADEVPATSSSQSSNTIKIIERNEQGDLTTISETVIYDEESSIDSIYLSNDTLSVLSNVYNFVPYNAYFSSNNDIFFPTEQKFNVSIVDVSEAETPVVAHTYTIDGALLNSRTVDNTLYIISSYIPYIEGVTYATTEEEKQANLDAINSVELSVLLPTFVHNTGNEQSLVNPDNCYLPLGADDTDGFDGIVTLTTININQPNDIESTCINADVSGIYASPNSIYLYGTRNVESNDSSTSEYESIIHKFSIEETALSYVATGTLDGGFGSHNPSLRFSESGEYLRVITTEGDRWSGYNHKVNILKDTDNTLELTAQLPNEEQPTLIGKVNEDGITQEEIKSVRFFADKAYIVTFLNTDPLYVIDLSDNESPVIAGALEIPGYSSYLHPISDNLLVGIGQNIDVNRLTDSVTDSTPIVEGAKVSLFDVSDISNPTEINSIVYAGGYTPVEFDYHALTYLQTEDGTHRFALPVERWVSAQITNSETGSVVHTWQPNSFLALLEITEPQASPLLSEIGQINSSDFKALNDSWYVSSWYDRSIIHGNDIYYLHGAHIWQTDWLSPLEITGPF